VTLVIQGDDVLLEIQDDGVGDAVVKDRHWGLQTMRERADALSTDLNVLPRPGGGTIVRLQSRSTTPEGKAPREHHSPARR
jgi:nitrate/nitrite-specific signal transduction histidine kinase